MLNAAGSSPAIKSVEVTLAATLASADHHHQARCVSPGPVCLAGSHAQIGAQFWLLNCESVTIGYFLAPTTVTPD
jgi:hypothetical protein